jgi:O-antigen ligase
MTPTYPRATMLAASLGIGLVAVGMTAIDPVLGLMAVGAAALALILAGSGSYVLAILFMSGTADLLSVVRVGSISPLGTLTVLYALGVWFLWLLRPHWSPRYRPVVVPFAVLVGWGFMSVVVWYTPSIDALQNLIVFTAFLGLLLVTARDVASGTLTPVRVNVAVAWSSVAACFFYAWSPLTTYAIGYRSFAIFALIGIAWFLAGWRCGSRRAGWAAFFLLLLIALAVSRTAPVVGLLLVPLARLDLRTLRGWLRFGAATLAVLVLLYGAVQTIGPLRSRFFEGDTSLKVMGVSINAEGRVRAWGYMMESIRQSPLIGHGAGSSEALINRRMPGLNHPHNDYLRLLHDYGLFGAACWLLGYGALLRMTWRAWLDSEERGDLAAGRLHLAAFLALAAIALVVLTDNAIVYIFVMAPLGVLVGASLGTLAAQPLPDPARARWPGFPARADLPLPAVEAGVRRVA